MTDSKKVLNDLQELCEYLFHEYKICYKGDEEDTYNRFLVANNALELLKEQQETIVSLQGTICKLNAALAEQPKQKFFVDSDGKMTPLPIQKHGHWVFDPDGMDWNIPAWKCSECHCRNDNIPPNLERTNPLRWSGSKFCPNCGAKMDEEVKQ